MLRNFISIKIFVWEYQSIWKMYNYYSNFKVISMRNCQNKGQNLNVFWYVKVYMVCISAYNLISIKCDLRF